MTDNGDYNCWFGIGRLTRDPEYVTLPTGQPMANFGMAVNRPIHRPDGSVGEEVLYIDVACYDDYAIMLRDQARTGDTVRVKGPLVLDRWASSDGMGRTRIGCLADEVKYVRRAMRNKVNPPTSESVEQ